MRKLTASEIQNLKKQLGGDVDVYQPPESDATYSATTRTADARVPSVDSLREGSSGASPIQAESNTSSQGKRKKGKKAAPPRSNPGESDYSVRFSKNNVDKPSKVAIVSSQTKKVVYEQG